MTPRESGAQLAAAFGLPVQKRFVAPGTWNSQRVLDALRAWASEVGRPPFAYEWCSPTENGRGNPPRGSERWARQYPRWPSADTVAAYYATWRAALLAAGLPGGRPPLELPLGERIEAARRMRASGISVPEIADELGVNESTVGKYLRATRCGCGRNWRVRGPQCTQCAVEANAARVRRWDERSVIDALKRWARIEGRPPSSEEWLPGRNARERWARDYPAWPSNGTVSRLFGSWNAAIAAAGFPAKPFYYTDEQVIDALQADARQRGRTPRIEDWLERPAGTLGVGAVKTHFGSWNAGLLAAGLRVTHRQGHWTRERVLAALQRDARRRGRAPTRDEWARPARGRPTATPVVNLFGSWNAGLRAAGLPLNTQRDKWTPTAVLDALRRFELELGRQPTSQDFLRPPAGYPNTAIIARKLGSWSAACRELGWSARQTMIADDTQMLAALRTTAAEIGPSFGVHQYTTIATARHWPSAKAIADRFGTWNKAKSAAGLPTHPNERGWSAEQLARALRALARRLRRTPLAKDWDAHAPELGWPHSETVQRRLGNGSWTHAITAAGLNPAPRRAWNAEQVVVLLRADAHRRGRPPRASDWSTRSPDRPTCNQVLRLFRTWNTALQTAGLETYDETYGRCSTRSPN